MKQKQQPEGPRKALVYCRVSSDRQAKEGNGLDSQEHRCKDYARSKGYVLARNEAFKDQFSGGGDFMNRVGMVSLLQYVDQHPYESFVVIFDDLSRFARDVAMHIKLRQEFDRRGIKIECPNFTFENTPEGELVETIMAAQNQYHRKSNRRQVIQKQKARLEAGFWPFNPPPGYDHLRNALSGKLLTPNDKAPIIREAFEGFASGRLRDQEAVRGFLQESDFQNGRKIYPEYVRRLLAREIYAGYIEYPDWEVSRRLGHHKAIISPEVFEAVQEKLRGTRRFRVRGESGDFPLRGLIVCSSCRRRMTAGWSNGRSRKYPYYRCQRSYCSEKDIRKEKIEREFEELLRALQPKQETLALLEAVLRHEWEARLKSQGQATDTRKRRIQDLKRNKEALVDKLMKTQSDAVLKAVEEKITAIENELTHLEEKQQVSGITEEMYGTALTLILGLLKEPVILWQDGGHKGKSLITRLVFPENPIYDRELGYGTANVADTIKLFSLIQTEHSHDVEMGGSEPPCKRGVVARLRSLVSLVVLMLSAAEEQSRQASSS